MTAPFSFEFDGTIEELAKYATEVFRVGTQLRVHARVLMPSPALPGWFRNLSAYGALPARVRAEDFAPVIAGLQGDRFIEAIKALRAITGWDLRASKHACEGMRAELRAAPQPVAPGKEFSLEEEP